MPRNLYCNVLRSSPNVQNLVSKIFEKYCKRLVSKVSCLISVSERSSLGLVSVSSRSRLGLVSVSSRLGLVSVSSRSRLGLVSVSSRSRLEDFGRDSSSGNKYLPFSFSPVTPCFPITPFHVSVSVPTCALKSPIRTVDSVADTRRRASFTSSTKA